MLENVVRDLTRAADELDAGAREVAREQDKVDSEITRLVKKVETAQKDIEETDYQKVRSLSHPCAAAVRTASLTLFCILLAQLRALEDYHLRLRTRLERPAPITSFVGPLGECLVRAFFFVVRLGYLAAWPARLVMWVLRMLGMPWWVILIAVALSIPVIAVGYWILALLLWDVGLGAFCRSVKAAVKEWWFGPSA